MICLLLVLVNLGGWDTVRLDHKHAGWFTSRRKKISSHGGVATCIEKKKLKELARAQQKRREPGLICLP